MKVTYLKLKNFASIFSGMNKKVVEIDFSNSINKVIIFSGPNGSGKTSILSALHPFAYNKEDETRDNDKLILAEVEGYKEIHFLKDGDTYIIKHHYLFKSGRRSVKSFITFNDVDLNPNGNVTSFVDAVKTHLGVEPSYLTLLRLGGDVKNFIDKKDSERKEYASNLMSEIDVYNAFYKKVTEESRVLRNLLKTTMSKIDRLHIIDEDVLLRDINELSTMLSVKNEEYDRLTLSIGHTMGNIASINMDEHELKSEMAKAKAEIIKLSNTISKIEMAVDETYNDETINIALNTNTQIKSEIKSKLDNIDFEINFILDVISENNDKKTAKEDKLKFITTESELILLKDKVEELRNRRTIIINDLNGYTDDCTVEDICTLIRMHQMIDDIVNNISAYGMSSINTATAITMNSYNDNTTLDYTRVDDYLIRSASSLQKTINRLEVELSSLQPRSSDITHVLYVPSECTAMKCPFVEYYEDNENVNNSEKMLDLRNKIAVNKIKLNSLDDVTHVVRHYQHLTSILNANASLIQRSGTSELFSYDKYLRDINCNTDKDIENILTERVSLIENLNTVKELDEDIKFMENDMGSVNADNDGIRILTSDIAELDKDIFNYNIRLNDLKSDKYIQTTEYTSVINKIENIETTIAKMKTLSTSRENLSTVEAHHAEISELYFKFTELTKTLNRLEITRHNCSIELDKLKNKLEDFHYKLREYKSLKADKTELESKFDNVGIIKNALSNSKGIPLLFQQIYLKDVRIIVNSLLEPIYKGQVSIEEFIIDDKQFRIPYIKNGILVQDVESASQGEKAFITLALSFALIIKTIQDYNILLLDEIDSTLDTKSRMLFINILEKQMAATNSEQVFVISHNNMFDSYPVDVIYTSTDHEPTHNNVIWQA